jgi:hypothetical protein
MTAATDPWALVMREPVVIAPEERAGIERQWDIFARMTPAQRLDLGLRMSDLALQQRRERLRRRFPDADERGLRWAVVREILRLDPGTDPVPR